MIPITITICLVAIAPFVAPDMSFLGEQEQKPINKIPASQEKSKQYFDKLEDNFENTKDSIRDLMAEHKENNP